MPALLALQAFLTLLLPSTSPSASQVACFDWLALAARPVSRRSGLLSSQLPLPSSLYTSLSRSIRIEEAAGRGLLSAAGAGCASRSARAAIPSIKLGVVALLVVDTLELISVTTSVMALLLLMMTVGRWERRQGRMRARSRLLLMVVLRGGRSCRVSMGWRLVLMWYRRVRRRMRGGRRGSRPSLLRRLEREQGRRSVAGSGAG